MNTYNTSIFKHKIPLEEGVKSFKQKQIQLNYLLRPVVQREIKKLCDAKIIIPVRYSALGGQSDTSQK